MTNTTIEQSVADAILQHRSSIEVDGKAYEIASPTPATLILISSLISTLPRIEKNPKDILQEVLRVAKDYSIIGEIAAILILGAKRVEEKCIVETDEFIIEKVFSWRKLKYKSVAKKRIKEVLEKDALSHALLYNCSIDVISKIIATRLKDMQVSSFFAVTTSLYEVNLISPTKEVETTASGQ